MIKKILPLVLLMILALPPSARAQEGPTEGAACTTAGVMARAGGPEITSPNGGNWLICNGSNWIMAWNFNRSAQSQVQFDYDTGACTTAKAGRIRFHSGNNVWSFCNGIGWAEFGRQGADSVCNIWGQAVGYVCPDGTVFAGLLPDAAGTPIFATRCDSGRTWNGSSCTGTRTNYAWGSSGSTRGTTDVLRGDTNTATLDGIAGSGNHPAAEHCAALIESGRSDWYLPAIGEYHLMDAYQASINDLSGSSTYRTSTEWSSTDGLVMENASNAGFNTAKTGTGPVRCIRRGY